jgi:amino acid adenylation domain-containing protein/non-ribosomal peptide synthase protein (TIGR01720 family)
MQGTELTTTQNVSAIEGFRLSPQQRRLWQQQPTVDSPDRVQAQVRIEGELDVDRLTQSLKQVVERYEILRTTFRCLPGMSLPLQVIHPSTAQPLTIHDFSHEESIVQAEKLASLTQSLQQPLSLAQASLFQVHLVRHSPQHHTLLLALPSLCADAATLTHLLHELSQHYAGHPTTDQPMQYADLAEWQCDLLESKETEAGRFHWQTLRLSNYPIRQLPLEQASDDFQSAVRQASLEPQLARSLEALAKQLEVSVEAICLACWQILIWRLTGKLPSRLGYACNGRSRYTELTTAIGLLSRDVPLLLDLDSQSSFQSVVQQAQEAIASAHQWQEYFDWELLPAVDDRDCPISFAFEALPESISVHGLTFHLEHQVACLECSTVRLVCQHRVNELTAILQFNAARLTDSMVERLLESWLRLLTAGIDQPNQSIATLPLLTPQEEQFLLVERNATQVELPPYTSIHHWFEVQVDRTPQYAAVRFEEQCLTYAELNARANQLAVRLQQMGVKSETIVAILLDRSLEVIVAMLAILKAGGVYLPLDPGLPATRLAGMLADAQACVTITTQALAQQLLLPQQNTIYLDSEAHTIAQNPTHNIDSPTALNQLAYVLYTSGSTGQPKGVQIEQRSLLNYVQSILTELQLPEGANYAMVSSFAADLGNTAIFPALCSGGCLHIIAPSRTLDADALAVYCRQYPIDCLKIVPSHLTALLSSHDPGAILPRHCLVLGGEATSWTLIQTIRNYTTNCRILNHYGPTETTIGVLTQTVTLDNTPSTTTIPLGKPLANTQIYLLDDQLQPVPIGVPGEIHIGGFGVARGYLHRSDLTTERFIPNPFNQETGSRLYKSGDLARYLPDGTLEFLGRTDQQVKIRGFRVELDEIAAILQKHPAVRQAIARLQPSEQARLVAYVVPESGHTPTTRELREFLQQHLPDYMVPAAIVSLRAFPLTANGKVDRHALPAPDPRHSDGETDASPRTHAERILAEIWLQLLGLKQVSIYDNFFELGGDSILSIQVIAKANQAGLRLTPRQLFEHQSIVELAAVAEPTTSSKTEQGLVKGTVLLTPIQHRFFEHPPANLHHWNQSVLLRANRSIDSAFLEQALNQLMLHHDALRLRFEQDQNGWQAVHAEVATLPLTVIDASQQSPIEQQTTIATTAAQLQTSLHLTKGPLARAALIHCGNQSDRLLLVIHHLVVDGVSWRILLEDLQTAYEQLQRQETVSLSAKTASFQQWSQYLQTYAQSAGLQAEQAFWLKSSSSTRLPVDDANGKNTIAIAQTLSVSLNEAETRDLLQTVPQAYQTQINDVLLTALVQTLAPWMNDSTLQIDLEGHGREADDLDLSRTVGWFTSVFPICLTLPKIVSPGHALTTIKEQLRQVPNRGMGYGVLQYLSQDKVVRSQLQSLPTSDVIFNYLGQLDATLPETALFQLAAESHGASRDPQTTRRYLLELNSMVINGQLRVDWTYSPQIHQPSTIKTLADQFLTNLRSLITHCISPDAGGYTPSDFPHANLNQADLDQILSRLS